VNGSLDVDDAEAGLVKISARQRQPEKTCVDSDRSKAGSILLSEFAQQSFNLGRYCSRAVTQPIGDLNVGEPEADQGQDIDLTGCKTGGQLSCRPVNVGGGGSPNHT
jgi:hypothetical protein